MPGSPTETEDVDVRDTLAKQIALLAPPIRRLHLDRTRLIQEERLAKEKELAERHNEILCERNDALREASYAIQNESLALRRENLALRDEEGPAKEIFNDFSEQLETSERSNEDASPLKLLERERVTSFKAYAACYLGRPVPRDTRFSIQGDYSIPLGHALYGSFLLACLGKSKLPPRVRAITGMSGQAFRSALNNLMQLIEAPRYLEIGSWAGSTAAASLYQNALQECTCIDNWSEFGGPRREFLENIQLTDPTVRVNLIEKDFRAVDYEAIGSHFNVFFFDGPHSEKDHYDGLCLPQPCLDGQYVLVVDDWNFREVRDGTRRAISDLNAKILFRIDVRTTRDNTQPEIRLEQSQWHNGCLVCRYC